MKRVWSAIIAAGLTAFGANAWAETGEAIIRPTVEGSVIAGRVSLSDSSQGLEVSARITGAPTGRHGFHIHEFGGCADEGNAAGGHFNPTGAPHGFLPESGQEGAHAGDMGNIEIGPDGSGMLTLVLPEVRLSGGESSVGGRAVILHEKADDFGQPSGNAGGRIGCGVIVITGK